MNFCGPRVCPFWIQDISPKKPILGWDVETIHSTRFSGGVWILRATRKWNIWRIYSIISINISIDGNTWLWLRSLLNGTWVSCWNLVTILSKLGWNVLLGTYPTLVGWLNQPILKIWASQIGSFPQGSGWTWKIFETTTQIWCKCKSIHKQQKRSSTRFIQTRDPKLFFGLSDLFSGQAVKWPHLSLSQVWSRLGNGFRWWF